MQSTEPRSTLPRIALVEDDETLAMILAYNLTAEGMYVSHFRDGQEAMAALCADPPHGIVLDWNLPRLSGIEVLRKIRRHPLTCNLPVLMLTARSEPSDRARALSLGVDHFLAKPFSIDELVANLAKLLSRRRSADLLHLESREPSSV